MPPRRLRVRIGKVKPGPIERVHRFISRRQYALLIGVAAVASVVLIWLMLSRMGTPPPPE
jgi:hypothetical protein